MTEPTSAQELFKGRHFDREIIVLGVRWYLTFKLSSRDLGPNDGRAGHPVGSYDDLALGAALRALILKSVGRRTPGRWVTRGAWTRLISR
jgi:hypothetical protein